MNDVALHKKARLGALIDQFLISPFYTEFMLPYLLKLQDDCKNLALDTVRQAGKSVTDIGLETAFLSGKNSCINDLLIEFNIWSEDGRLARAKIEKLEVNK